MLKWARREPHSSGSFRGRLELHLVDAVSDVHLCGDAEAVNRNLSSCGVVDGDVENLYGETEDCIRNLLCVLDRLRPRACWGGIPASLS